MNIETITTRLSDLVLRGLLCALFMTNLVASQAEQVTHTYDDLNRLIKTDYGNGNYIEYSYDATGNRISRISVAPYTFSGFFSPIDNPPTQNEVKAGSSIPVKFNLAGNQGLNIFATGYPVSHSISCSPSAQMTVIEETEPTDSNSDLSYDPNSDQYKYVWKTAKSWKGTCRQLILKLDDGTEHRADFWFK